MDERVRFTAHAQHATKVISGAMIFQLPIAHAHIQSTKSATAKEWLWNTKMNQRTNERTTKHTPSVRVFVTVRCIVCPNIVCRWNSNSIEWQSVLFLLHRVLFHWIHFVLMTYSSLHFSKTIDMVNRHRMQAKAFRCCVYVLCLCHDFLSHELMHASHNPMRYSFSFTTEVDSTKVE